MSSQGGSGGGLATIREVGSGLLAALADAGPDGAERERLRRQVVELHVPLVEHCARRFRNRGEPFEDLVQVGTVGLIKAVDRFDRERGVEFSSYATPTIIGEIKRHFRDRGWAIRVPRRLQELRMQLGTATAELTQSLGRAPTPAELARTLERDVEEVMEALESGNAYATVSLDAGHAAGEGDGVIADLLGSVDAALERVELRTSLRPLLDALPDREKQILLLRFFHGHTQSQIAAEIGVSQMHVSRLLAQTLERLREALSDEPGPG